MQLVVSVLTWLMLLLAFGFVINGFYALTRGQEEELPDGTKRRTGQLLKGWYFFWFRERDKKYIMYREHHLNLLVYRMRPYIQDLLHDNVTITTDGVMYAYTHAAFLERIPIIEKELGIEIEFDVTSDKRIQLAFYKEEPDYVFNEYIRKVLAGCITCFSSLYGSLLFWSFDLLAARTVLASSLYGWVDPGTVWIARIAVWLATIVSLCYVNTVLWKKFNQ